MTGRERSYGGKTADQRAAERRERLVAATIAVLAGPGGARPTMTAVCAAAGLTERYFYESFGSLDDALLAALDSVCAEIAGTVERLLATTTGSAAARVHTVLTAVVDLVVAQPAKASVAVIQSSVHPQLRARRHELIGMFADLVAREAAELYGDRAWPPERARIHGLLYVAGFAELVESWLTGGVTLTPGQLVEVAEDLFAAVAQRPDPAP